MSFNVSLVDFQDLSHKCMFSVHVRDAVAAMESRINSTSNNRITKVVRSKPVQVKSRPKDPPEIRARKQEYRRSMSDSSDSQISFKQIKEMWDQTADQSKKCAFQGVY